MLLAALDRRYDHVWEREGRYTLHSSNSSTLELFSHLLVHLLVKSSNICTSIFVTPLLKDVWCSCSWEFSIWFLSTVLCWWPGVFESLCSRRYLKRQIWKVKHMLPWQTNSGRLMWAFPTPSFKNKQELSLRQAVVLCYSCVHTCNWGRSL